MFGFVFICKLKKIIIRYNPVREDSFNFFFYFGFDFFLRPVLFGSNNYLISSFHRNYIHRIESITTGLLSLEKNLESHFLIVPADTHLRICLEPSDNRNRSTSLLDHSCFSQKSPSVHLGILCEIIFLPHPDP